MSYRDFVSGELAERLLKDIKELRIFNEADMQYRAAAHLDKRYFPDYFLANQPTIKLGVGRGTTRAKPDIVIYHHKHGPQIALELKCFLKGGNQSPSQIAEKVWADVYKLRAFQARHAGSSNTFAVVAVELDRDESAELKSYFTRSSREEWMKHYFFSHVINVACDENGRRRPWYRKWADARDFWLENFSE